MRVLIVNVDSVIPNLALHKIEFYHKWRGDEVLCVKDGLSLPLFAGEFDKAYVSCVFDYNRHRCRKWEGHAEIGGGGYSLRKTLPPEIDKVKPKINLGFTTRGCIRNCPWCIVPEKEGKIKAVSDIYDIWDGESKDIILLDNNILALPEHFFKIAGQLKKEGLAVDFNQGLDCRLLTDDICKELFSLRYPTTRSIRFAFDDIAYKPLVLKALKMLKRNGLKDWSTRWYVYVGTKDTVDTVLERISMLRDNKCFVYLMRDKVVRKNPVYLEIFQWCGFEGIYKKTSYYFGVIKACRNRTFREPKSRGLNVFERKNNESKP